MLLIVVIEGICKMFASWFPMWGQENVWWNKGIDYSRKQTPEKWRKWKNAFVFDELL